MQATLTDAGDEKRARDARRGLAVYFVVVVALSAVIEGLLIARGKPIAKETPLVLALMWTPAVASIIARLALREGFSDVSFRLRWRTGRAWLLLAWLHPVAVGAVAYGAAWALGLARFHAPDAVRALAPSTSAGLLFVLVLVVSATIGALLSGLSALGEEIGWRGYMLTRLFDARVPRPVLVSGVVWGLWHVPLIVSGQYAAGPRPVLSAALFLVGITAGAYVHARVRLESGSVWPAALAHASWNAIIQGPFDMFFGGDASRTDSPWIGESGVLVVVALCALAAAVVLAGTWRARRDPRDEGRAISALREA